MKAERNSAVGTDSSPPKALFGQFLETCLVVTESPGCEVQGTLRQVVEGKKFTRRIVNSMERQTGNSMVGTSRVQGPTSGTDNMAEALKRGIRSTWQK